MTFSYLDRGHGTAVVLLHGIGSAARSFDRQISHLSPHWRVVAWDAPGYGGSSDLPMEHPTASDYADALVLSVRRDDGEMLELLLSGGADANARVTDSDRPFIGAPMLGVAAAMGGLGAIRVLLANGAEVDARLPQGFMRPAGMTPLTSMATTMMPSTFC